MQPAAMAQAMSISVSPTNHTSGPGRSPGSPAPLMAGNCRIENAGANSLEAIERLDLIVLHETAVTDDIHRDDGCQFQFHLVPNFVATLEKISPIVKQRWCTPGNNVSKMYVSGYDMWRNLQISQCPNSLKQHLTTVYMQAGSRP